MALNDHTVISKDILNTYIQEFKKDIGIMNIEMGLSQTVDFHGGIIEDQEGYKKELAAKACSLLAYESWKESQIGSGDIAKKVKSVMRLEINKSPHNLVDYRDKDKFDKFVDEDLVGAETLFYDIYCKNNDASSFEEAVKFFGERYPIISYLFFVKDCDKYTPARPNNFSKRFSFLGIKTNCLKACTWENFKEYNSIFEDIQLILMEEFGDDSISLLDAHTFVWMAWMADKSEEELKDIARGANDRKKRKLFFPAALDAPDTIENNKYDDEYETILKNSSLKDGPSEYEYVDISPKPVEIDETVTASVPKYKRDSKVAQNALAHAGYRCECDPEHPTFVRKNSDKLYTESHHLIPMQYSDKFENSLDTEVNIVSLCSNCHNMIHYGKEADMLIRKLYKDRAQYLKLAGIEISEEQLLLLYGY